MFPCQVNREKLSTRQRYAYKDMATNDKTLSFIPFAGKGFQLQQWRTSRVLEFCPCGIFSANRGRPQCTRLTCGSTRSTFQTFSDAWSECTRRTCGSTHSTFRTFSDAWSEWTRLTCGSTHSTFQTFSDAWSQCTRLTCGSTHSTFQTFSDAWSSASNLTGNPGGHWQLPVSVDVCLVKFALIHHVCA